MNILCASSRVPWPLRDGGNVRSHGLLRELGRRHRVTYLCRVEEARPDAEAYLKGLCESVELVVDPLRLGLTDRLRAVAGGKPFGPVRPADPFFRRFRDVLDGGPFDLAFLVGVDTAWLAVQAVAATPVVWDVCDCTSRYYARQARAEPRPARRLWYRLQARRYRQLERSLFQHDLTVIVSSASEAEAFRSAVGSWRCPVEVVPIGIEPMAPAVDRDGPPCLAFTGSLGYPPNADAVRHLCRDIFPRIRRVHPEARLLVIGGGASPELRAECDGAGVDFLGFVPNVFDVLRRATVFVCPMRQGTGIKIKLLEALACGLPAVASSLAREGLPEAEDRRHLRVADSPEAFVDRVLELLADAGQRRHLGAGGRALTAPYAWDRLGDEVDRLCRETVARRRGSAR